MNRFTLLALAIFGWTVAGCAVRSGGEAGQAAPRGQSNQISVEEVVEARVQNAHDLIRAVRPNWLQFRGQQSLSDPTSGQVIVYIDGTRAGTLQILRQIPITDVHTARYLSASEATARFGTNHTGGVIQIMTRRQ